ncbi:hypothetical protein [Emticicia sp. SJ17W-69]|uniref:dioxygenase family protein n=1 Tax=Emticicia sp. SJ17W-69 TaxID=3421657 RepID=UPI003EC07B82
MIRIIFCLLGCLLSYICFAQATALKGKISLLEQQLVKNPKNHEIYQSLTLLIPDHYVQISKTERLQLSNFLKNHAFGSSLNISSNEEAGKHILIKGRVLDQKGKPIPNAFIHVFHADSKGYYAPTDSVNNSMAENDPRLFGFLRTDNSGSYEVKTIRPASYPKQYNGRTIPQHIHFRIIAEGFAERNIQMVFEDDPAMSPYWKEWAKNLNYPIVKMIYSQENAFGVNDIILIK